MLEINLVPQKIFSVWKMLHVCFFSLPELLEKFYDIVKNEKFL